MFKPILHKLKPGDAGYAECRLYNNLIKKKPTGDMTLMEKVAAQRAWKTLCEQALLDARAAIGECDNDK